MRFTADFIAGVAFVTSDKTEEDINYIRTWPGKDGEWKVPTRIAYAEENIKHALHDNVWGYEVESAMVSCSWTKLLLDVRGQDRTIGAREWLADGSMLRLPFNKTAQQVCSDFLRELYRYLDRVLARQMSNRVLVAVPMDFWMPIPASWSEQTMRAFREAARTAGFGSRPSDTINLIAEPEAAVLGALYRHTSLFSLNPLKVR